MNHLQPPKRFICLTCFFLLAACSLAQKAGTRPWGLKQSCVSFVQKFYDWYVPKALKESGQPASNAALKYKGSVFSPELLQALKEDSEAQAMVSGKIVGIDFDPFLSGQDPCERYVAGNIARKKDGYLVEVYGICLGNKHVKPDVVAEVILKDGRWQFMNFHYVSEKQSEDINLLGVLKRLQEDRQKTLK